MATSKSSVFNVDRDWLMRLAQGHGRNEPLTGMQRHFIRVIDGSARPVEAAEKTALVDYEQLKAEFDGNALNFPLIEAGLEKESTDLQHAVWSLVADDPARPQHSRSKSTQLTITSQIAQDESNGTRWHEDAKEIGRSALASTVQGARSIGEFSHEIAQSGQKIHEAVAEAMKTGGASVAQGAIEIAQSARDTRKVIGDYGQASRDALIEAVASMKADGNSGTAGWASVLGRAGIALLELGGKAVAGTVEIASIAVAKAGEKTSEHSQSIGAAASGASIGVAKLVGGVADSIGVEQAELDSMHGQLIMAMAEQLDRRQEFESVLKKAFPDARERLLECTTIAGMSLSDMLARNFVPDGVAQAYSLQYPLMSQSMDFREKIDSLRSDAQVEGLVNGVKGKLFEINYLKELNDGGLPQGWQADLAHSANQSGWDIQVFDNHGHLQELLSLKATEHVAYIHHALEIHPDIDVVSTSEVYSAMLGTPQGEHLIDGGINEVDLHNTTQAAADGHAGSGLESSIVNVLAMMPAAFTHFSDSGKSRTDQINGFSGHVSRAKTAAFAGKGAMLVVPYFPVALLASFGMSLAASVGNNRREQLTRMQELIGSVRLQTAKLQQRTSAFRSQPRKLTYRPHR